MPAGMVPQEMPPTAKPGPVACQGIRDKGFERSSCGHWEREVQHGHAKMWPSAVLIPGHVFDAPAMPMALAVLPKDVAAGCGAH